MRMHARGAVICKLNESFRKSAEFGKIEISIIFTTFRAESRAAAETTEPKRQNLPAAGHAGSAKAQRSALASFDLSIAAPENILRLEV